MKVVMINGQNHKGSSYNIGRLLVDEISGEKEVKEFFLPRDLNHFCVGCYSCIKDETKCPYYEEKNRIMKEIEQADLLVFTTPTYCMAPSAPMKAFIDLTFSYWLSHKPRECMFSKKAVVISTAAGVGTKDAIKPVARTLSYWGISNVKKYGVSVQAMNWEMVSQNKKEKIQKKIKKLANSLSKKSGNTVSLKTKFMFWFFAGMQKSDMGSGPEERQYWIEKGWLGKKRLWKKN